MKRGLAFPEGESTVAKVRSTPRRTPKQRRSQYTRDAIFEATAQILETQGEAALTTNRIAERAGVSVGTLYQYFANKEAILIGIARRESERLEKFTVRLIEEGRDIAEITRATIRFYINMLADRRTTRLAALNAIQNADTASVIGGSTDRISNRLTSPASANRIDAFVLTRAVTGVVKAAVLEGFTGLHEAEFEDAIVRLVQGFRPAPAS